MKYQYILDNKLEFETDDQNLFIDYLIDQQLVHIVLYELFASKDKYTLEMATK